MTCFCFVHGINSGPKERAGMLDRLTAQLKTHGLLEEFSSVHVAQWRSLGNFMADLYDLKIHQVRWDEAVEDVRTAMHLALISDERMLVVAHSMGQPLTVAALIKMTEHTTGPAPWGPAPWERASLLSLGGPMGNPIARPYFQHMPQHAWGVPIPHLTAWEDVYNLDDGVNGGRLYEKFRAAQSHQLDVPGWSPNPLAEHSAYFQAPLTYALIQALAEQLDQPAGA